MGSEAGLDTEKILDVEHYADSERFSDAERVALRYADAITRSDEDVSDELFQTLTQHFSEEQIVELTAVIAWENASSKFNRALRIGSQQLWNH